jgi:hypothetical protein
MKSKINEIFKTSCQKNNGNVSLIIMKMNFEDFENSLKKMSLEVNRYNKKNILKKLSVKKEMIDYMEIKELQRINEEKEHNKFTEKITGGIPKKCLEKNQFNYIFNHRKLLDDMNKDEVSFEKEEKKSEEEQLNHFYKYLGLGNSNYKKKMKKNFDFDERLNRINQNKIEKINNEVKKFPSIYLKKNNINKSQEELNSDKKTTKSFKRDIFSNKINWNQMKNIYYNYNPLDNYIFTNKKNSMEYFDENMIGNYQTNKNTIDPEIKSYSKNILPLISTNHKNSIGKNDRYKNKDIYE